jgi:pilus assembly protein Flp/PilA
LDVEHIEFLRSLLRDRRGVTALEYGIIAGVLGLVLITIFKSFGTTLSSLFSKIGASI